MSCQQDNPAWGACALCIGGALVGSALTLLAIELRRKSLLSSDDKKAIENGVIKIPLKDISSCENVHGELNDDSTHPPDRPRRQMSSASFDSTASRPSFSGSFSKVDGEKRDLLAALTGNGKRNSIASIASNVSEYQEDTSYADNGTNVVVLSEQDKSSVDAAVLDYKEFDEHVVSKLVTFDECKQLLHRTRSVSALASRLMAAPDEEACYEVASRLLVPLFCVDRCSYVLMKDAEHIIVKGVAVKKRQHAMKMGFGGAVKPIKDTMVGVCASTLQQQYCPRTAESKLKTQQMMHTVGINSILATPILVNGSKFAGAIVISMTQRGCLSRI
ncbi:hypothetical protein ACHAXR_002522 [Thalassiosira sp. AJA248-18]